MPSGSLAIDAGACIALLAAGASVLYDCHVSIQDRLKRVPIPIYRKLPALCLAFACGVLAALSFFFTDGKGDTLVDSVLGLKQPNPLLRGLCVGLTVLVLIRSKLFSIKGAEFGGELVYNTGRAWVMKSLNSNWQALKGGFNKRNLGKALLFPDYDNQLLDQLRAAIAVEPEDFRVYVEGQIATVSKKKPTSAVDPNAIEWQTYYRTLTNLALDYAGAQVFEGWTDFK